MKETMLGKIKKRRSELEAESAKEDMDEGSEEPMDEAEKALHIIISVKSLTDLKDLAHGRKKMAKAKK